MWRSIPKSWVTREFFIEWFYEVFALSVKKYLEEKNVPPQDPSVVEQCTCIQSRIGTRFKCWIRVKFKRLHTYEVCAPNTTSFNESMDQKVHLKFQQLYIKALFQRYFEVIVEMYLTLWDFWKDHFNTLQCLRTLNKVWDKVFYMAMESAWKISDQPLYQPETWTTPNRMLKWSLWRELCHSGCL